MNCADYTAFISALCDGERIPREAALHLDVCPDCRARLADYVQMGVELKRIASETAPEGVAPISWGKQLSAKWNLWRFGWEHMRVPRFAFALMIVLITGLSVGLLLVRARVVTPWWFEFSMRFPNGNDISVVQKSSELEAKPLGSVQRMPDGYVAFIVRFIDSKEESVQIGIRARKFPSTLDWHEGLKLVRNAPEQLNWYAPGQKVRVPVQGYESVEFTGQLLTEPPQHDISRETFLPKLGELRLSSPVLIRDGKFVADMNGATTYAGNGQVVAFYAPGEGLFLFSLDKFDGAVDATLENSQLEFTSGGHAYRLLTGSPIVGGDQFHRRLWAMHEWKTIKVGDHGRKESVAIWSMKTNEVAGFLHR